LALFAIVSTLLISLPLLVIITTFFTGSFDVWKHLYETVLWDYISNSFILMLGVGIGVLLIGVPSAWLTSSYEFPGRKIFSWALLLPLAMPAYIIAYTYTGMLDFAGPVQTSIREWSGLESGQYWFFEIRSLTGAIVMLTLVLYPYVYLLARTAFLDQSASLIEAGRSLGYSYKQTIFSLALPLARPAIIAGMTLALMETLADFGTVQYFGVNTFTTGIFRAFYSFGDTAAATQLATILLGFVTVLIVIERYSRRKVRYHSNKGNIVKTIQLQGRYAFLASLLCGLPLFFGFIIPAIQLLYWTVAKAEIDDSFLSLMWNSFYLAFTAAFIAASLALIFAYAKRLHSKQKLVATAISATSMGYALPGTIIAIGVIVPFSWLDHKLIYFAKTWFDVDLNLIFSGTLVAVLFAYTVRFLAVSFGAIDSGLQKIKPNLDNAGQSLGQRPSKILKLIHLPLLRGSVLTALLIVFVDVLKELPATLILRPFNFNTLSIRAYELASDERLIDAAPASLLIVLVGLIPVILLSRSINSSAEPNIK
jgi:iron(III) transport system permease protein